MHMHKPKSSISVYMLMDVTTNYNIKDEKELLQFALEKRIIDVESIKNVVADMTRKESGASTVHGLGRKELIRCG